jgi:hypothetical protein
LNSIQTVGGFHSYQSSGGECSYLEQTYVRAYNNCNNTLPIWYLSTSGTTGVLGLSDGSGSGGLDGQGAQVYATTAGGFGILRTTASVVAGSSTAENSSISILGMGTTNVSSVQSFFVNSLTGSVQTYQTFGTAGTGVPPIYYSLPISSLSSSTSTALGVGGGTPPAGLYRISQYMICSSACTTGSVGFYLNFTDTVATHSLVQVAGISMGSGTPAFNVVDVYSNGSSMSYAVNFSGTAGGAAVQLAVTMERLQ